ncbi:NDP-hexose 2,3-dehydratase family protein [Actinocrispum wychmicini]|uniref:Oxidase EvaA n=1 Tax=Actinocrispum wychmicini TaxID=1213861 RepID=A0A4V2S809_9PSEU|nr:NDP-hexose 2,3-dehydratase family protein [Actinocrispum wychmicini]TCO62040.1 oxidase EvaA [Actinocrispum wychmicini]
MTTLTPQPVSVRAEDIDRFTRSALTSEGIVPTQQVHAWFAERRRAATHVVRRVPFSALTTWQVDQDTGDIAHQSGKFFTIEGLRAVRADGQGWTQPVINQPEVGILGILAKEFDGVLHLLMQAKMEPGNINLVQLSPTVQATFSNYTQVHGGTRTRHLDHFRFPGGGTPLVDVLQSEQGAWFYRKRNRNMVVEADGEVEPHEDFCWLTLGQIRDLLRLPHVINMPARSVLGSIPYLATPRGGNGFRTSLGASLTPEDNGPRSLAELIGWLNDAKLTRGLDATLIRLNEVTGWHRTDDEISDDGGRHFSVIGVSVSASTREVTAWQQPMLAPRAPGLAAFVTRNVDGVLRILVRASAEAGLFDRVEIGPTVQCVPGNRDKAPESRPALLDYVRGPSARVRFDVVQSEEGGRFYQAQTRYLVVEAGDDLPAPPGDEFTWMTFGQLMAFQAFGGLINVQARTLITCLNALW